MFCMPLGSVFCQSTESIEGISYTLLKNWNVKRKYGKNSIGEDKKKQEMIEKAEMAENIR